jgi:DNA-binding response OmpR family regulator
MAETPDNKLRPSELIARQKDIIRDLEGMVDVLKAALAAEGVDTTLTIQPWMRGLTHQERAVVGALYAAYPRVINKYDLLELLPGFDHVAERTMGSVGVAICKVRKKIGKDAIENVWGSGFKLGDEFYSRCQEPIQLPLLKAA